MEKIKAESMYDKAAMRVILQPLIDEELAEFDEWNKIPHEYSQEFHGRFKQIMLRDKFMRGCRTAAVWARKIAVCFAVVITLALVACTAIEPIRERVADAFVTWYEKYNDIVFEMTDKVGIPMQPTYIPEGYYEAYRDETDTDLILMYENDEMLCYAFTRFINREGFEHSIDNEKRIMEEIEWRGGKAIFFKPLYEYAGYSMMWEEDGYIYTVDCDVSKEELFKFAESVK